MADGLHGETAMSLLCGLLCESGRAAGLQSCGKRARSHWVQPAAVIVLVIGLTVIVVVCLTITVCCLPSEIIQAVLK